MTKTKFFIIALMLSLSGMANAPSPRSIARAFERVLDAYCIEYYNIDFSGRSYVESSIVVNVPSDPDDMVNPLTGAFELTGTHSYKGAFRNNHSGVKWRATIKKLGDSKYKIKFDKWYEADLLNSAHWENGPTRIFEYGE